MDVERGGGPGRAEQPAMGRGPPTEKKRPKIFWLNPLLRFLQVSGNECRAIVDAHKNIYFRRASAPAMAVKCQYN